MTSEVRKYNEGPMHYVTFAPVLFRQIIVYNLSPDAR